MAAPPVPLRGPALPKPSERSALQPRWLALAALFTLLLTGCSALQPAAQVPDRATIISRIIGVTVKVTVEREGKRLSSASGVVVASGLEGESLQQVSYVLTAGHAVENKPNATLFVRVASEHGTPDKLRAELYRAAGPVDLALLRVPGVIIPPATLADPPLAQLGEGILVAGFPWGRRLGLFAGIVSQVPGEGGDSSATDEAAGELLVVDAASANGVSGGGVFREATGVLLGVVEGFQTASIAVEGHTRAYSLKVPLPGETFVVPADRIRAFLRAAGPALTAGASAPR